MNSLEISVLLLIVIWLVMAIVLSNRPEKRVKLPHRGCCDEHGHLACDQNFVCEECLPERPMRRVRPEQLTRGPYR